MLATLLELGIPHEDIDAVLATKIPPSLSERFAADVEALTGSVGTIDELPKTSPPEDAPAFYGLLVFAAAVPAVKTYHATRGIPEATTRLILTDVGRQVAVHRRRHGRPGIDTAHWLTRHFQGRIFQLGRLQFEQVTLGTTTGTSLREAGLPYGPGDPALSIHIPEYCGPFTPEAIDDSLAQAAAFFPRYFGDYDYRVAVCHSWLLDPQLDGVLPASSNILAFQRRFTFSHATAGEGIMRFVTAGTPLHETVQAHVAAGNSWQSGSGWMLLP